MGGGRSCWRCLARPDCAARCALVLRRVLCATIPTPPVPQGTPATRDRSGAGRPCSSFFVSQGEVCVETTVFLIVAFASGYVIAVNSWALIRRWVNGIEAEADRVREQADAKLAKAKFSAGQ